MTSEAKTIACAQCGNTCVPHELSEAKVELENGSQSTILLCDRICYPDFWDNVAPGEFTRCDAAGIEVCKSLWTCEECSSVYDYDIMALMLDTDHEPPSPSIVCSFCRDKESDRWIEK